MPKTSIAWTDYSWPVVNGCRRVSAGCQHCYAERLTATRLRHLPKYAGLAEQKSDGPHWTGQARLWEPELEMPLRINKPSRIFVADMGDLFYEGVPDAWIDRVFEVMLEANWHTYQILTKRPRRMMEYVNSYLCVGSTPVLKTEILSHIWMGISVEDQHTFDERWPFLQMIPAKVRFVSYEPVLGPVDFHLNECLLPENCYSTAERLSWIIVGGESGPHARPCVVDWIQSTLQQCRDAQVACFVKQVGSSPVVSGGCGALDGWHVRDWMVKDSGVFVLRLYNAKGDDPDEWPMDLRIQEWPR